MAHKTNEIKNLMHREGFVLIREHRHMIWRHPVLGQVVTPKTFSDGKRAMKNCMAFINKLRATKA